MATATTFPIGTTFTMVITDPANSMVQGTVTFSWDHSQMPTPTITESNLATAIRNLFQTDYVVDQPTGPVTTPLDYA